VNTRIVGPSRFVAAASATVITAVSAWAFVSSSASIERDPFHFASIMAQAHNRAASSCPNNPEIQDHLDQVCVRG